MRPGGVTTDHPLERLIFFSDAVFAIAITLLVIEIHVPTRADVAAIGGYGAAFAHLWPSFFGFVLSFLVIARFWMGHHAAFAQCSRFDRSLLWPNTFLLMAIAFMPFATAFLAQNMGELVPAAFYNGTLLITALLSVRVIDKAIGPALRRADADEGELSRFPKTGRAVALGAGSALLLGLWAPQWSQAALLSIPLWRRLLIRLSPR